MTQKKFHYLTASILKNFASKTKQTLYFVYKTKNKKFKVDKKKKRNPYSAKYMAHYLKTRGFTKKQEQFFKKIEDSGIPILKEIVRKKNLNILNDASKKEKFFNLIAIQFLRSPKTRKIIKEKFKNSKIPCTITTLNDAIFFNLPDFLRCLYECDLFLLKSTKKYKFLIADHNICFTYDDGHGSVAIDKNGNVKIIRNRQHIIFFSLSQDICIKFAGKERNYYKPSVRLVNRDLISFIGSHSEIYVPTSYYKKFKTGIKELDILLQ